VIVDTSALVGVLFEDPEREAILERMKLAEVLGVGAPTLVETAMVVVAKMETRGRMALQSFVEDSGLIVVAFGENHWRSALDAFSRFGKGRHPARLNFGDCLAYAVAKLANQPLLCVGADFAQTDLELVAL
jgi:ribonuclease VapC